MVPRDCSKSYQNINPAYHIHFHSVIMARLAIRVISPDSYCVTQGAYKKPHKASFPLLITLWFSLFYTSHKIAVSLSLLMVIVFVVVCKNPFVVRVRFATYTPFISKLYLKHHSICFTFYPAKLLSLQFVHTSLRRGFGTSDATRRFDGLVQESAIPFANALELRFSCTYPWI